MALVYCSLSDADVVTLKDDFKLFWGISESTGPYQVQSVIVWIVDCCLSVPLCVESPCIRLASPGSSDIP